MPSLELSAGRLDYADQGSGPPVVLLHGVMMDHTQWDAMLPLMPVGYRYVRPILPLGAHAHAMRPDADLSHEGVARLIAELLEALDLEDVTLVHTDWGGGLFLTALGLDQRVGALVVFPCEAFDNFPIGLPGRVAVTAAKLPGGLVLGALQLRVGRLRRSRLMMGLMAKHPLDDDLVAGWTRPVLTDGRVRRDLRKFGGQPLDRARLVAQTEALSAFRGRLRVVWSPECRATPPEHGQRLAGLVAGAELVQVPDAFVLTMLDQPAAAADAVASFLPVTR